MLVTGFTSLVKLNSNPIKDDINLLLPQLYTAFVWQETPNRSVIRGRHRVGHWCVTCHETLLLFLDRRLMSDSRLVT